MTGRVATSSVDGLRWIADRGEEAGDHDEPQAQAMLARMYFMGEGGLTQSFMEAYKWVVIAGDAAKQLTEPIKIALEMRMQRSQFRPEFPSNMIDKMGSRVVNQNNAPVREGCR